MFRLSRGKIGMLFRAVDLRNGGETVKQLYIKKNPTDNLLKWQQVTQFCFYRRKYTDSSKYKGGKVAGQRHKAINNNSQENTAEGFPEESIERSELIDDREYDSVASSAMHVTKRIQNVQHVAIIQPYIKWGPRKSPTAPELLLQEAEALVRSLPKWNIELSLKIPVETLDKRQLFGTGKLEELKETLRARQEAGTPLTCVFISKGTLSYGQKQTLEQAFRLPVMDRYSIVVQILRLHAVSMEAKLQVALAELPYIWSQVKDQEGSSKGSGRIFLSDSQRQMLQLRERKLRHELAMIHSHRELLRNRRRQKNFPVVAVVGYTNAGKTSLIKALTEEQNLQPRDQLFATLDVTAHAGLLPCKLEVLYMDTVGFMADIPTGLIECFVATLEDAMLADVIVHVQDLAHENCTEQKAHVERTLRTLMRNGEQSLAPERVINVGNKVDLVEDRQEVITGADDETPNGRLHLVSSKTLHGIHELLLEVERKVLQVTGRQRMVIKVPMGGQEVAWLYKHAAVTETAADPTNAERLLVSAVITKAKLQQFRHLFILNRATG
ncbi:putative GTP-binding protein 6 [Anopheles ziemanni]|uniref:putative GTP-binding protein 6 n=1 Tax=Anopheles coustani TaxID=139045 RepID=UPI00265886ED|nr:putative GTP-binding protein 6 [Anopheles coustani]XP_058171642.1 putative GTP-binding protein 6 [Anopheles ziemanni]